MALTYIRRNSCLSAAALTALFFVPSLHGQAAKPAQTKPAARRSAVPGVGKLPANIPPARGLLRTAYALRYVEIKVGTGPLAEPNKLYSVHYTGWLHDGTKFDSSVDRGEPIQFPQGAHRVIPGWDTGFEGMHVGGKRRLFIPWELAYGAMGRGPIPPKADLIFDVELVDMKELPENGMAPGAAPRSGMHLAVPGRRASAPPDGEPQKQSQDQQQQGQPQSVTAPPGSAPPATPPAGSTPPATEPPK